MDTNQLRISYYDGKLEPTEQASIPRRWTLEEDTKLVLGVTKLGRGVSGIHQVFMSLGESRSFDEIVDRIAIFFPEPPKKYKKGNQKTEDIIKSNASDWSVDDALLLPSGA
jgi:hypothetical protein